MIEWTMRILSMFLLTIAILVLLFRNFNFYNLLFIGKNVLIGVNVVLIISICFLLTTMIIYYRSDEGVFRRPHNVLADRTDNTMLYRGIKYGIISLIVSSLSFYVLI